MHCELKNQKSVRLKVKLGLLGFDIISDKKLL